MFPMYRLCFQSNSYVSNIQIMFPISYVCFQYTVYVSKRKWCFQNRFIWKFKASTIYHYGGCCVWGYVVFEVICIW